MAYNYLYKKEFLKSQKEKGLCIECKNPVNNTIRCEKCKMRRAENKKKKYAERKKDGVCSQCGVNVILNKTLCEKHYLMQTSFGRLGTGKYWKELKLIIEKQDYKCGLTGDKISFESEIELDHIQPKTRTRKNELSNVRWVTKESNRLKQNKTDAELKELCKKILQTI